DAGAFVWQPAKSAAQGNIIHLANLIITRIPFAKRFNRAGERGGAFDLPTFHLAVELDGHGNHRGTEHDAQGELEPVEKAEHHANPSRISFTPAMICRRIRKMTTRKTRTTPPIVTIACQFMPASQPRPSAADENRPVIPRTTARSSA